MNMKGILKKTSAGWFVWYSVMRDEITSGYDSLPLHPESQNSISDCSLYEGTEIEFEIERYCSKHNSDPSKNSVCTLDCGYDELKYAKITVEDEFMDYDGEDASTWPLSETYTLGCSYPDCICQGDEITYCQNRTPEQVHLGHKTALVEWEGVNYLGEVDGVKIYHDSHHPDQTLTVELNEEKTEMKYIIGPYNDITIFEGIKKNVIVSEKPTNMIKTIDESWEEIEEEYLKDNYPVFGGPFTDALTPFEWLKRYFKSPKRLKN